MRLHDYLTERNVDDSALENHIRDMLSQTKRTTTADIVYREAKNYFKGLAKPAFMKVWNELVDEGYLIKVGSGYKWEM